MKTMVCGLLVTAAFGSSSALSAPKPASRLQFSKAAQDAMASLVEVSLNQADDIRPFARCVPDYESVTKQELTERTTLFTLTGDMKQGGDMIVGKGTLKIVRTLHQDAEMFWYTYDVSADYLEYGDDGDVPTRSPRCARDSNSNPDD